MAVYFAASFGNIPMLITSIETERGRDVAVLSPSLGDQHTLSDRGQKLHQVTCEILFCNRPGERPYLERYNEFAALADEGAVRLLTHPLDGSYPARIGEMNVSADAGSLCVHISCTFLREDPPKQVFPAAAGTSSLAGVEAVSTAAAAANAALDELELEDSPAIAAALEVPDTALSQVTAWSEAEELDSQEVFLGIATLTKAIDDAMEDMALATDLSRWQAYKEMVMLRYAIVRAGQALTADSRDMFDLYVETPRPLLAICAEVYGGALALELTPRVTRINRLRVPGLVPAGTTLKMPRVP